jgi:hypothetical protein
MCEFPASPLFSKCGRNDLFVSYLANLATKHHPEGANQNAQVEEKRGMLHVMLVEEHLSARRRSICRVTANQRRDRDHRRQATGADYPVAGASAKKMGPTNQRSDPNRMAPYHSSRH